MEISTYLSTGILAVSCALTLLGLILKYRTGTSNELIACVLVCSSVMIWSLIALVQQLVTGAGISVVYVLLERGLNYGLVSVCLAVFGWDLGHGIYRYRKNRRERKDA